MPSPSRLPFVLAAAIALPLAAGVAQPAFAHDGDPAPHTEVEVLELPEHVEHFVPTADRPPVVATVQDAPTAVHPRAWRLGAVPALGAAAGGLVGLRHRRSRRG